MVSPLLLVLLLLLLRDEPAHGATSGTYLPLAYTIPFGDQECLYERISHSNEHLTASLFVVSGDELASVFVFEGPVAPVDLDPSAAKHAGGDLQRYLDRYQKEGVEMFVQGKFGDRMLNVKPVRIAEVVNFEEEEEDFFDDYHMTEREREDFNAEHDREHQHENLHIDRTKGEAETVEEQKERQRREARLAEYREHMHQERDDDDDEADDDDADDGVHMLEEEEERLMRMVDKEGEIDDDFVKESLAKKEEKEVASPERRRIVTPDPHKKKARPGAETPARHRRLFGEEHAELKLVAGEPFQKTILVASPGWYRLCVNGKSSTIEVELELRKSSIYGEVDRHTGHVPSWEDVERHAEIRSLYEKEDDATVKAEEAVLKEDDLRTTKEQLRILEKVYGEIVAKQLEERRLLHWRTVKNQHLYSHLVLGNLVETIVYMGITGLQVYTIRRWFAGGAGGQTLGR